MPLLLVKCKHCDIMLEGRMQFLGHMIHGHNESIEQAGSEWNFACSRV